MLAEKLEEIAWLEREAGEDPASGPLLVGRDGGESLDLIRDAHTLLVVYPDCSFSRLQVRYKAVQ